MQKLSLTCFGVGDGWPCHDRNHASFFYRFGRTSVLVDCGEPVDGRFKASGLSYDLFDGILLSHMHADHVGGLFMLLQGAWLEGRKKALPIHMPRGAISALKRMLEATFLFKELLPFDLTLKPLRSRQALR
jgi:ribonuclease Z